MLSGGDHVLAGKLTGPAFSFTRVPYSCWQVFQSCGAWSVPLRRRVGFPACSSPLLYHPCQFPSMHLSTAVLSVGHWHSTNPSLWPGVCFIPRGLSRGYLQDWNPWRHWGGGGDTATIPLSPLEYILHSDGQHGFVLVFNSWWRWEGIWGHFNCLCLIKIWWLIKSFNDLYGPDCIGREDGKR